MKFLSITILLALSPLAAAVELNVDPSASNRVKFISDAPVERFEGTTSQVDGYVLWQGNDLSHQSEIYMEVDLASLDTGIGLRNRHMRDHYLETDSYPYASFRGRLTESIAEGDSFRVMATGEMTMHGITRIISVSGMVTVIGDSYNVRSTFTVALTDYDIKVPKLMFFKIDENMEIQVNISLKKVN